MMEYHILKAIQSFIFPPGIFVVFLLFATVYAKRYKALLLFFTITTYLLSTQYIGNLLLSPLENPYKKPHISQKDAVAVVVLGGGFFEGSPNLPLSNSSFKRAVYGYKLSQKENLKLLYAGSKLESKNAKLTFLELFEDDKSVTYLQASLNTLQNALSVQKYFKKKGVKNPKIYLVTSAFHITRATRMFEKVGIKVYPRATDFKTSTELCFCFFTPSILGLSHSYKALHEYLAMVVKR